MKCLLILLAVPLLVFAQVPAPGGGSSSGTIAAGSANDVGCYTGATTISPCSTGNATWNVGLFINKKLDVALGTITADAQAINSTATWNAAGVTFTHILVNITSTASAAASKLMDLRVGGVSQFNVDKSGSVAIAGSFSAGLFIEVPTTASIGFLNRGYLTAGGDGVWALNNLAGTGFGRLQFGGTSASFPSFKRSSASIIARLADDSADTTFQASKYLTETNCASGASPSVCGSASSGAVALPVGGTTLTVNTTAVVAASRILITENTTVGGALSVTCNTTIARVYAVTTITASTSFVITTSAAPITNPACLSYLIVN